MRCPTLSELPPPPPGKTGWPWTEESTALPTGREAEYRPITIVSPSFNTGRYLEETIRSILLQGYPNLEYIIIDGGSTDGSLDIVMKYAPWITSWVSEPDGGYADAVNKGFARATGDILAWMPISDRYVPGALAAANHHLGDGTTDLIFGRPRRIKDNGDVVEVRPIVSKNLRHLALYARRNPSQPTTFWRKELHQKAGSLNANLRYAADSEWFLRLSLIGNCRWIPDVICDIRVHADQISTVHFEKMRDEWFTAWSNIVKRHGISRLRLALGAVLLTPFMRYRYSGWKGVFRVPKLTSLRGTLFKP